ncbi:hypothetical protein A2592_00915 [Candidatus Kaiserbacteria bacterium RIFOXYD1_FULL_42_15]|uniref:BioF2-like acetyltransferase domain-containing protein n=1 Tax=Candidatus Kaiserbacteria bacterium RIFOXYD1_FULL_42_15 TaxID=1798532 RepID=A0A1F6FPA6_9BACT|nr:MAG: hypothetical protein A2592_00915 [Candidatus Kaiserbacteria bacterium RIFOXYD1_FULL_42_15]
MLVTFGHKHKWVKKIESDILVGFGKSNAKKITNLLRKIETLDITSIFAPLDQSFLDWFVPLYNERIRSKENPNLHDIYAATLGKAEKKFPYYTLTLFEAGIPIGGAIFTLRTYKLSIAFRVYFPDWQVNKKLACSPALFAEYIITKHAQEKNKTKLVHGSDRNPYGIYSSIGVAIFKLSVGCYPVVQYNPEIETIDTTTVQKNIFLLELPKQQRRITDAYLITTKDAAKNFEQALKYENQLRVQIIYRDNNELDASKS